MIRSKDASDDGKGLGVTKASKALPKISAMTRSELIAVLASRFPSLVATSQETERAGVVFMLGRATD